MHDTSSGHSLQILKPLGVVWLCGDDKGVFVVVMVLLLLFLMTLLLLLLLLLLF